MRGMGRPITTFAMRASLPVILLLLFCFTGEAAAADARGSVLIEPETQARFPLDIRFAEDGARYRLSATGAAVRTKFWFNIYSIAHYLEDGPKGTQAEVLASTMSDDTAKQVTLVFARDLRAEQVRDGFLETFAEHASAEEMRASKVPLRHFLRSIRKDVSQGDRFAIRWLPGGRLIFMYNGRVVSEMSNRTFARVLWSVWFDEASIVDRHQLIMRRVLGPEISGTTGQRELQADLRWRNSVQ